MLTLFVNHFKSQYAKNAKESQSAKEKRGRQAESVANTLKQRYGSDLRGSFVVLGDFNANYDAMELQDLLKLSNIENVVQNRSSNKLKIPGQDKVTDADRWTHYLDGENTTSQLDYIILSPSIAERSTNEQVIVEKCGLAKYAKEYTGERLLGVGPRNTEASEHCAVFTTLQI